MCVASHSIIHPISQYPFRFPLHTLSVHTRQRWQIQLKRNMFLFQSIIVFLLHIFIPFRMCQQRIITFLLNALQNGQKIHRRVEVGGLHQQKRFPSSKRSKSSFSNRSSKRLSSIYSAASFSSTAPRYCCNSSRNLRCSARVSLGMSSMMWGVSHTLGIPCCSISRKICRDSSIDCTPSSTPGSR